MDEEITIPDNMDAVLDGVRHTKLTEKANERREMFADNLERLARDIRNFRESPHAVVCVLLSADGPTLMYSALKSEQIKEASDVLNGIVWRSGSIARGTTTLAEVLREDHERREQNRRTAEETKAAALVAKPYQCEWCSYRTTTRSGRDQHMRWQKNNGCVSCHEPRCVLKSASYDYSKNYRGDVTCGDCLKALRAAAQPDQSTKDHP